MVLASFFSILSSHKKHKSILLLLFLCIPVFLFAQDTTPQKTLDTPNKTLSTNQVPDFFRKLEAPQIIKNNVRVNNLTVTKTQIDTNNQLVVEGTVEIRNYADAPTSRLYMTSYLGIKGTGYYLQYPLYHDERSEPFVLEPKQSIIKSFRVVENNFLAFGAAGVEVAVFDEYDHQVHIDTSRIYPEAIAPSTSEGTIFADFDTFLVVDNKEFVPSNGPTFYPDTEEMFLKFNFKKSVSFIDTAHIKIFNRNFFTAPIKEIDQKLVPIKGKENQFTLTIPKDLKPGVYPIDVELISTDNSIFVPHIYGRFIVGGNMSKVTDVALRSKNFGVTGLTVVVQGNAPDIVNPDKEKEVTFSAEIFVYDKKDTLLFSKKIDNQSVSIYRNIDIDFDKTIGIGKITKVKVELSDGKGIFNTYIKEFTYKNGFNWWNVLFVLGAILILILILKKRKLVTVGVTLIIFSSFFTQHVEAGMSPAPYKQLGVYEYDGWDLNFYSNPHASCNLPGCYGLGSIESLVYDNDADIKRFDNILDIFGINITFDQPVLYSQDPSFCYAPGQVIPVVMRYDYALCTNSPIPTCDSGNCDDGKPFTGDPFTTIYVYANPTDWSWNLRNWEVGSSYMNDPSYNTSSTQVDQSIHGYNATQDGNNYRDKYQNFDIDYLASYIDKIAVQSQSDNLNISDSVGYDLYWGLDTPAVRALHLVNINTTRISEVLTRMTYPISSTATSVPIPLSEYTALGSYSYSLVAPEKPGLYPLTFVMFFTGKQGIGHYLAQQQIRVCDSPHDADYLMPGTQIVDSNGNLKDQDGSILTGYTIQKYPITPGQIKGNTNPSGSGSVDGFNTSPDNEFDFVTTANYCGSKSTYDRSPWLPDNLNNKWVNYFSSPSNLSTKIGWYNMSLALYYMPTVETSIPIFGYYYDASAGTYFAPRASSPTETRVNAPPNFDENEYIVRKVGNELKFIDLSNPIFPSTQYNYPTNSSSLIKTILRLEDIASIPTISFGDMLSMGKFDTKIYSNPSYTLISPSTNTTANTYLLKDSRTFSDYAMTTSCSIFVDFCPSVPGVQYLLTSASSANLELWNINSDNTHTLFGSTAKNSPKAVVDALCYGYTCQGPTPSNAVLCPGDDTGLTSNVTRFVVNSCSSTKCEYTCQAGYYNNGGVCTPYTCQGPTPSNAVLCPGDDTGLTSNVYRSVVSTCSSEKCEYTCQPGYYNNGGVCTPYTCQGPTPSNAVLCAGDDTGLTSNVYRSVVSTCSSEKCEYTCQPGSTLDYNNGTCSEQLAVTCSGSPLSASIGQQVTWTATISGGEGSPSNFYHYWYGNDADYDYAFYSEDLPAHYTYTTPGIKRAYLGVYDENWAQYASTECDITVEDGSTYTCQGAVPANATLCAGDDIGLTSNVTRSLVNNCGATKCEYTCQAGFINIGGVCMEKPPTPTGFRADASACGNNWLNLSWNVSPGATSYQVKRGGAVITLTGYTCNTESCSGSDMGLMAGTTYPYTVTASNAVGTSSAALASGTVSSECDYTLTITTAGNGGGTTTGAGTYTSGTSITATATPNAASTFIGWSGDCTASGQVTMSGNKTCTATFTVIPLPPTPTGLSVTQSTCGNSWLNLSWNMTFGATAYNIYRDGVFITLPTPDCMSTPGSCKVSDTGLTPGNTYSYTIEASNITGTSTRSNPPVSGTVSNACQILPDLTVSSTIPGIATINIPQTFTATVTANDAGTGVSFNNFFQISTAPGMTGTVVDKTYTVMSPLAEGETGISTTSHTFSTAGTYYIRVCADKTDRNTTLANDSVDESDEDNNCGPETTVIVSDTSVNAQCGYAEKTYPATDTNYGTYTFCNAGSSPGINPDFPPLGGSVTWTCSGIGSGSSTSCTAQRNQYTCFGPIPTGYAACPGTPQPSNGTTPYTQATSGCGNIACTYQPCKIGKVFDILAGVCKDMPLDGCFADDTTGKNLDATSPNYYQGNLTDKYGLLKRVNDGPTKMGYILTDPARASQTKTFRTKLTGNVNKYITSRYLPILIDSDHDKWDADFAHAAPVITLDNKSGAPNSSGYFYYQGSIDNSLLTVTSSTSSPILINKPTVLYVSGADIYIKNNITYSATTGDYPSLVIIIQRDSSGKGGDIYIDPSVTQINGTLIADGALMNGVEGISKNWIANPTDLQNRLLINGRLLTYNARGGSLKTDLTAIHDGTPYAPIPTGNCAIGMSVGQNNCSWIQAASQDLERFRMIPADGIATCSLYVTNVLPERRPDILRTVLD